MKKLITLLCLGFFTIAQAQNTPINIKDLSLAQEPQCTNINKTIQKEGRSPFWQCVDSWVYNHFTFPEEAFNNQREAIVWIPFLINEKGTFLVNKDSINITVPPEKIKDLDEGKYNSIKEVCYNIFATFPNVIPAKNTQGQAIPVKGKYPISFIIPLDENQQPIEGEKGIAEALKTALKPVVEKAACRVGKEHLSEEEKTADANRFFSTMIRSKYHYPPAALELGISGKVTVKIEVDTEGKITAKRISGPNELYSAIPIIFTNIPDFVPARDQYGNPIKMTYVIAINISLAV